MKKLISILSTLSILLSITPYVFAEEDYGVNVALGKPVYTEVQYPEERFLVKNITDGDLKTVGSSMGNGEKDIRSGYGGFTEIDLVDAYEINTVVVRTRRDGDYDWARKNFMIVVANKPDYSDAVEIGSKLEDKGFGDDLIITLDKPVRGRYVFLVNTSRKGSPAVSEIEVYGTISIPDTSGSFKDVTEWNAKNAVNMIYALGIAEGMGDGNFGAAYYMTRGEAAKMLCNFARVPVGEYGGEFQDVSADNIYAPYITAGVENGFFSKNVRFRPDDFITGFEFLKTMIYISGNSFAIDSKSSFPQNLTSAINLFDLMNNVTADMSSYINRSNAAIIMYNTLIANCFRFDNNEWTISDKTVVEKLFGYELKKGTVTGSSAAVNEGNSPIGGFELVEIDGITYDDRTGKAVDLIGKSVYYLLDAKNGDHIIGMWQNESKLVTAVVDSYDFVDADRSFIYYQSDGKTKKHKIDAHPYVFINETQTSSYTPADFVAENGYTELIDSTGDGVFETVKINRPDIFRINSIEFDTNEKMLNISSYDGAVYRFDYDRLEVFTADGKRSTPTFLQKGGLIYLYASQDGKYIKIISQNVKISGIVTSVTGDKIGVDGVEYQKTKYYTRNHAGEAVAGKQMTFVLDGNNRLITITDEEIQTSSERLVFIVKCHIVSQDDIRRVQVFTTDSEFIDYDFAERVWVDGASKNSVGIDSLGEDYFTGKLALIKTNNKGQLSSIITENTTDAQSSVAQDPENVNLAGCDRMETGFYKGHNIVSSVDAETPMFVIPVSSGAPLRHSDYDRFYKYTKVGAHWSVTTRISSGLNIKRYGVNEFGEPAVLVVRQGYNVSTSSWNPISDANAATLVFDSYRTAIDADGEICYQINAYNLNNGTYVTVPLKTGISNVLDSFKLHNPSWFGDITTQPTSDWMEDTKIVNKSYVTAEYIYGLADLNKGDIIRYSNGWYSNASELERVAHNMDYDKTKCKVVYTCGWDPSTIRSTTRLQYGIVDRVAEGRLVFWSEENKKEAVPLAGFGGTVLVVDGSYISAYPVNSAGIYIESGDRVTIYTSAGYHKSIVVYK